MIPSVTRSGPEIHRLCINQTNQNSFHKITGNKTKYMLSMTSKLSGRFSTSAVSCWSKSLVLCLISVHVLGNNTRAVNVTMESPQAILVESNFTVDTNQTLNFNENFAVDSTIVAESDLGMMPYKSRTPEGYVNVTLGKHSPSQQDEPMMYASTSNAHAGSSVPVVLPNANAAHDYVNDCVLPILHTQVHNQHPPLPPRSPIISRQQSNSRIMLGNRAMSESEGFSTDNDTEDSPWPDTVAAARIQGSRSSARSSADYMDESPTVRLRERRLPTELVTANFEYKAFRDDELTIKRGSVIEVLSKDAEMSGGDGWWTGRLDNKIGVFPSNFVQNDNNPIHLAAINRLANIGIDKEPLEVAYNELLMEGAELIGAGGFGKVFKGMWRNEVVAVKEARYTTGDNLEEIVASVRAEARLFHLIKHNNIVSLRAVCLQCPHFCLILEYCEGGPLNELFREYDVPPAILIDWAVQIANGMHYLHEGAVLSLVHRDLKSSNVLIKQPVFQNKRLIINSFENLILKITDFGLAREATHTTRMTVGGTYAWMAPEVIKSSTFSKASDVWSFGVLIWELLTGETPFKSIDYLAVAYGVATGQLSLPIPVSCPLPLRTLLESCWAQEPHERPTFKDLLDELNGLLSEWSTDDMDNAGFQTMQQEWKHEIEIMFDKIKEIESDLKEKEHVLRNREQEVAEKEQRILQSEELLKSRERAVLERELALHIKDMMFQQQLSEPVAKERMGRMNKRKLKSKFKQNPELISGPKDFRTLMTVRPSSESPPISPTTGRRKHVNLKLYTNPETSDTPTTPGSPPDMISELDESSDSLPASMAPTGLLSSREKSPQPPDKTRKTSYSIDGLSGARLKNMVPFTSGNSTNTPKASTVSPHTQGRLSVSTLTSAAKRKTQNLKSPGDQRRASGDKYGSMPELAMHAVNTHAAMIYPKTESKARHDESKNAGKKHSLQTSNRDTNNPRITIDDMDVMGELDTNNSNSGARIHGLVSGQSSGGSSASARSTPRRNQQSPQQAGLPHTPQHRPSLAQLMVSNVGNVLTAFVTRRDITSIMHEHQARSPSADSTSSSAAPLYSRQQSRRTPENWFHTWQSTRAGSPAMMMHTETGVSPSKASPFRRAAKQRHSGSSITNQALSVRPQTTSATVGPSKTQLRPCLTMDETRMQEHMDVGTPISSNRVMPRQTQSSQALHIRTGTTPMSPLAPHSMHSPSMAHSTNMTLPRSHAHAAHTVNRPQPSAQTRSYIRQIQQHTPEPSPPSFSVAAHHNRARLMHSGHRTRSCDHTEHAIHTRTGIGTRATEAAGAGADLNMVIPPPIVLNPLTGTSHAVPARPMTVWNAGYECCTLPQSSAASSISNANYYDSSPQPERPRTLALSSLGQEATTPAESGISTAGSSVSFPASSDAMGSSHNNLLDVQSSSQALDTTPPIPPRQINRKTQGEGVLSPVVHSPPD